MAYSLVVLYSEFESLFYVYYVERGGCRKKIGYNRKSVLYPIFGKNVKTLQFVASVWYSARRGVSITTHPLCQNHNVGEI
jgi:hypothetical protein